MASHKINFRNLILEKKELFNHLNNRAYIIEAAVLKGVYYGVGGTKIIPLPHYCSIIVDSLKYITRAKGKFEGDKLKDLGRLRYEITKHIYGVYNLDVDITNEVYALYLYIEGKRQPYIIDIKTKNTNTYLADVGTTLVDGLSKLYVFNSKELNLIHITFEKCLNHLDRGY